MNDQTPQPLQANQLPSGKKKMSNGMKITLIIVGTLMFIFVAFFVIVTMYVEDIGKYFTKSFVEKSKSSLVVEEENGVDTVFFNSVADRFMEMIDLEEFDSQKSAKFFLKIQTVAADDKVDSAEAMIMIRAMVEYYPELIDITGDLGISSDSLGTQVDSTESIDTKDNGQ